MDLTGKPMAGFIYVGAEGLTSDSELTEWVDLGLQFNSTMPEK
jgi:hypothetical protein